MAIVIPGANQLYRRLRFLPMVRSRLLDEEQLMDSTSTSPFAESFRLLALNINASLKNKPTKGVAIVSAYPGDGRSFVAANLAVAMAERQPTILHDGHARAESPLGALFKPRNLVSGNGASSATFDQLPATLSQIARPTQGPQLWLTDSRPTHASDAHGVSDIVRTATDAGFVTVIDTPPASISSEAFALAQEVGQVVYVIRRRPQDMEIHERIRGQLDRLDTEIIGLVTNEA